MPKWMINFYWFCLGFLILVCGWLVFDQSTQKAKLSIEYRNQDDFKSNEKNNN